MPPEDQSLLDKAQQLGRDFTALRKRLGARLTILAIALVGGVSVWWRCDDISNKLGFSAIVSRLEERPIPTVRPGSLTIAVAPLLSGAFRTNRIEVFEG
jgi:hypothetical protein